MAGYGNVGSGAEDVGFVPKVWSDHITAYFRRKMALGQLALIDNTLKSAPGETVHFPFFTALGDAEEPSETTSLTVDKLIDSSFSCTVKEVGKAVGWKDSNVRMSSVSRATQETEAQTQISRVFAEKVDKDLITAINADGASVAGFTAASAADKLNIRSLQQGKIVGFGDRHEEAVAVFMHSLQYLDMMNDSTAGFMQANAVDPLWGMPGFQGRLLGMAVITLDTMPEVAPIESKRAFASFIVKPNAYGIYMAEDMKAEMDRDILYRETLVAATMWYGVLSLHAKVSAKDYRICKNIYATSQASA